MAGRGGYRQPPPGGVPMPGAMSQRTDRQPLATLPDAQYGEERTFHDQQAGAPLARTPAGPAPGPVAPAGGEVVGLDAPTQFPEEPVTAGVPIGPGPGPEALARPFGTPQASYGTLAELLGGLAASDASGSMAALMNKALELGLGT